jgi:signal transduction histidine kinase
MRVHVAPMEALSGDLVARPVTRRNAQVLTRFPVREHSAAVWAAMWAAAAAAEFGVLVPVIFAHGAPHPGYDIAFRLLGGSFAACGLIAWRRRPDSRSGALMVAAAAGFFVAPLFFQFEAPIAQTIAVLLNDIWTIPFIALLLTFLTGGRVQTLIDRVLVGVFVLALVVLQLVWMLFLDQQGNVLGVIPHDGIAHVLDRIQRVLTLGGCVATVVVIAARWRVASPPRRRALLPSVGGAVALTLFASLLVNDLIGTGTRAELHLWLAIGSLGLVPALFLAGLLRSRLARSGLADLVRSLRTMGGADLEAALARTLGDPGLVVARVAPGGGYVDARGEPVTLPTAAGERRIVPVERDGQPIAALAYDASLDDDPALVEAVSAAAAIALENEQLQHEADARLTELQASRERIVAAGDAERRRLERDLHDGAQQRLVALAMQLRFLQTHIRDDPSTAEELAGTASAELAESLQELRELARGIHPAVLDHGLETALESLVSRSPVPASLRYDATGALPPAVEIAAYFVVSEALTNVAKYAQATAAEVRVSEAGRGVVVQVTDDGIGGASPGAGSGLRGLADRVEALDGHLSVLSARGGGTTVTAELPCAS